MKKKLTVGLLRQIIKEELNLSEDWSQDAYNYGSSVSAEVGKVRNIAGWIPEYYSETGGIVWFNEDSKYMDEDGYSIWEIHSSPFFNGEPEFTMSVSNPNSGDLMSDIVSKKVKPSGDVKKDAKLFLSWFKSNLPKAIKMIEKKSK